MTGSTGIGKTLRALREKRGYSQAEVARRMDTHHANISHLEADRADPQMITVHRYLRAIEARMWFTLDDTPPTTEEP